MFIEKMEKVVLKNPELHVRQLLLVIVTKILGEYSKSTPEIEKLFEEIIEKGNVH